MLAVQATEGSWNTGTGRSLQGDPAAQHERGQQPGDTSVLQDQPAVLVAKAVLHLTEQFKRFSLIYT